MWQTQGSAVPAGIPTRGQRGRWVGLGKEAVCLSGEAAWGTGCDQASPTCACHVPCVPQDSSSPLH